MINIYYIVTVVIPLKLLLRRGTFLLIAGGIIVVTSFVVLAYYSFKFITNLNDSKQSIGPSKSWTISKYIQEPPSRQGAYIVTFPEFSGESGSIRVTGPTNQTIVQKSISVPILIETFAINQSGNYTLKLTNLSFNKTLVASALLGDEESIVSGRTEAFSFLLIGGIAVIGAGVALTFWDRRRLKEMKKFGDTSDLV